MQIRDYSLLGQEADAAVSKGLADAIWYTSPIPREKMRELLERKNGPAIIDTIIWFGLLIGFAILTIILWGSWWVLLPYMFYAVLFASSSDSRWHESSHGTAFKTDWMNNVLYEISSFMVFRQSTVWRYSHTRHHSDTLVRGRDPEIAVPRPPDIPGILLNFFALKSAPAELRKMLIHASGRIDKEVATYLPDSEYAKVIRTARIYLFIFIAIILSSIFLKSPFPVMFVGLPTLVGSWLMPFYGLTQHAGLAENVLDHRLNCRTVYMNRIHRFLYWNMNYHIEHHMFPLVPYHALPKLHELMKDDCPAPYHGIVNTFKEIIPALLKQIKDPRYYVKRELPQKSTQSEKKEILNIHKPEADKDGWIKLMHVDEIKGKDIIRIDCDEDTFALYQLPNGKFYASEGICTHGSTHLADGLIVDDQIECAKHNGRFKIKDGSAQRPPVCVGLKTFKVKNVDNVLYLNTNPSNSPDAKKTYQFKVVSNTNVATYIKELVLEPTNTERINFTPGDYMHLEIPAHKISFDEIEVIEPFRSIWNKEEVFQQYSVNHTKTKRNYSLANNPVGENQLRFNVRLALPPLDQKVKAGIGSSYVFNLKVDDHVHMNGPYGEFHIKESDREMVYIGGGAGMAPLRCHISYLFDTLKTKRKVSFWYGARSLMELYYEDYFKELASQYENFDFQVALSEPRKTDNWTGHKGFIHSVVEENYLNSLNSLNNLEFYLCGPPAMIDACLKMLENKGVGMDSITSDEY